MACLEIVDRTSPVRGLLRRCVGILLAAGLLAGPAGAQNATWDGTAGNGDWNNPDNWSAGVPTGTATFTGADPTIVFSFDSTIGQMQFTAGAPAYSFDLSGQTLQVTGAGILNGSSNRPTFLVGGTLDFLSGTAGNAIINNVGGFTVFGNNSNAGTAAISNSAGSVTSFTGDSSAADATIDNDDNGATQFRNDSTAGNATINNNLASSQLGFFDASRAGTATILNRGTLFFGVFGGGDSASADRSAITNEAGAGLGFFGNTTAGDATIVSRDGSQVLFFENSTGGNARFITDGTSQVDFSGTTGPNGDGQISAGSIEGAGLYGIGPGNTLTIGGNNLSTELSGVLADNCGCGPPGSGSLRKVGSGTFTLSGTNTYTGTTTVDSGVLAITGSGSIDSRGGVVVNGGSLIVDGTISQSSNVVVNGGLLGGTGTLPTTTLNGGTLSPGNSTGTITITGNLVLSTAATYLVEVSSTSADRTNVTGTATLNGTLRLVATGGTYTIGRQYILINATGGRTGTFSTVDVVSSFGTAVRWRLVYDNNNVILVLDPNLISTFVPAGTGSNQQHVAGVIDQILLRGDAGDFLALFGIPTGSLPGALAQLTGEIGTAGPALWFEAMRLFLATMIDPYAGLGGGGGPPGFAFGYAAEPHRPADALFASFTKAPVAPERRWTGWGAAFGSHSSVDGNAAAGSNRASARNGNVAAGADYRVSPATRLGFAVAGGTGSFGLPNGLGGGEADTYQLGVYGVTRLHDLYLAAAGAFAWADVTTDRAVAIGAASGRYTAGYRAEALGARIEAGHRFAFGRHGVTPFAALLVEQARMPAYNEQTVAGATAFALAYGGTTAHRSRSELGLGLDARLGAWDAGALTVFARVAWAHEFTRDRTINAAFQLFPVAGFTVRGAEPASDAALLSAGAELRFARNVALRGKFEGEFADSGHTYAATGALRATW